MRTAGFLCQRGQPQAKGACPRFARDRDRIRTLAIARYTLLFDLRPINPQEVRTAMSMLSDFKQFAVRGNVIDLAVGFILGTAFGKITTSLVNDVIMPPVGLLLGKVDFSSLYINLSGASYPSLAAAKAAGAPIIAYGSFINTILDFVIVAFAMFILVQQAVRFAPPPPPPADKECPHCLSRIPAGATKCAHCTAELAPA
jgi:large conductance mechanosensitive channel